MQIYVLIDGRYGRWASVWWGLEQNLYWCNYWMWLESCRSAFGGRSLVTLALAFCAICPRLCISLYSVAPQIFLSGIRSGQEKEHAEICIV